MILIYNPSTDPHFNLACEQYLLDSELFGDEAVFMLWRNSPAVIIGRNQNAYAEINIPYVTENDIAVVRRLTGGGAVFHDLGNLNYTFIVPAEQSEGGIDFARFCTPVIEALRALGADASLSGRNDIMVSGKKVSGSAQTVRGGKRMHHGCMLYSADLTHVAAALKVNAEKLKSKGIKSVSSRVDNIRTLAGLEDMDVLGFADYLMKYIAGSCGESCTYYSLTDADRAAIEAISSERYSSWEWNFGLSHEFGNSVSHRFDYGTVELSYTLDGGIISEFAFSGDYFGQAPAAELAELLIGCRFVADDVSAVLECADVGRYISGSGASDICSMLFGEN